MNKATEAFGNYKERDENPPKKKVVENATEAVAHKKEAIESLIAQGSSYTPTYLRRKLGGPGARS